jgi:hypothetical protein
MTATSAPEPNQPWTWIEAILGLYFTGSAVMLTRLIVGTVRALTLTNRATRANDFFTSPDCAAPVTVGWFHPVIILPENWRTWPAAELDAVLIHEREHARRRDPLVQWLALLNRAFFWFHPVAWWLERKLAELAEETCDAAVLRAGHDPKDYSEYLIDMASAVRRAGSRLPVWGTAMVGGGLDSRIQGILDWAPMASLPRSRAMLATALCAVGLATFGACTLGRVEKLSVEKLNPGQVSMNDMSKRENAERMKKSAKMQALAAEAGSFTPDQVAAKLASVKMNPQDEDTHYQLVHYYATHRDPKGKNALILWYIEHAPDGKENPGSIQRSDREAYEQGKRLWLANTKKPGATANAFTRAAAFMRGSDIPLAEDLLLAGRRAYQDDPRWARLLGSHYAKALLGSAEVDDQFSAVRSSSVSEARDSYAQSVRTKLEQSTESEVVAQVAQTLTFWGQGRQGPEADTLALAESLVDRALTVDPASHTAASVKFRVKLMRLYERLRTLRSLSAEQRTQLGDEDRILLIRSEMDQAWGPSGIAPKLYLAAAKAHEVLALAEKRRDLAPSAAAIFQANFMLGKVALRQFNNGEAARYLLLAADAPPSEELRYDTTMLSMNLPRALVDWGQREAVAEFLVRVAPKTLRTKEFQDWAAEIRQGNNPNMMPIMIGCGQEPC